MFFFLSTGSCIFGEVSSGLKRGPGPAHLVIHPLDVGDVHVVSGGTNVFILLTREDIDPNQVNLHTNKRRGEKLTVRGKQIRDPC